MLEKGDKAPAFNLTSDTGQAIGLKDIKDRILVLYFFPKANTPG